jgi:hypothetical protein
MLFVLLRLWLIMVLAILLIFDSIPKYASFLLTVLILELVVAILKETRSTK